MLELLYFIFGYAMCYWLTTDELLSLRYQNLIMHRTSNLLWEKYEIKRDWSE